MLFRAVRGVFALIIIRRIPRPGLVVSHNKRIYDTYNIRGDQALMNVINVVVPTQSNIWQSLSIFSRPRLFTVLKKKSKNSLHRITPKTRFDKRENKQLELR